MHTIHTNGVTTCTFTPVTVNILFYTLVPCDLFLLKIIRCTFGTLIKSQCWHVNNNRKPCHLEE